MANGFYSIAPSYGGGMHGLAADLDLTTWGERGQQALEEIERLRQIAAGGTPPINPSGESPLVTAGYDAAGGAATSGATAKGGVNWWLIGGAAVAIWLLWN